MGVPLPEHRRPQIDLQQRQISLGIRFVVRATRGIVATAVLPDSTFEVDVRFNPGISGGPVLDIESGKVVGMAQATRLMSSGELELPTDLGIVTPMAALRDCLKEWGTV